MTNKQEIIRTKNRNYEAKIQRVPVKRETFAKLQAIKANDESWDTLVAYLIEFYLESLDKT